MEQKIARQKLKIIFIHVFIGAGVFYFLVHPFTMVLYNIEFNHPDFTPSLFRNILKQHLLESFSFKMGGMAGLLSFFGGMLGIASGFFWIRIKQKRSLRHQGELLGEMDLKQLIQKGENDSVEFKSSVRYDYHRKTTNRDLELVIAKTLVGFMNAKGGKLLIGVSDQGDVIGLEKDLKTLKHKNRDGFERKVFQVITDYIGREACYNNQVSFHAIGEKDICLINVEPSTIPVYLKDGKNITFYVRTGNATHPLSVEEAINYLNIQNT
ncbi:AlbA family DNA-binding domain-containing protein [Flagellimonas flava]|uniref:AlbA family DNA-binding domain-containing protein n=1 Tax=Flagellimonas TaxID=444459 RepID=UPI003D662CE2